LHRISVSAYSVRGARFFFRIFLNSSHRLRGTLAGRTELTDGIPCPQIQARGLRPAST
jgi:hypothetical protein